MCSSNSQKFNFDIILIEEMEVMMGNNLMSESKEKNTFSEVTEFRNCTLSSQKVRNALLYIWVIISCFVLLCDALCSVLQEECGGSGQM